MNIFKLISITLILTIISINSYSQTEDLIYEPSNEVLDKTITVLTDIITYNSVNTHIHKYIDFLMEEGYNVILHKIKEDTPTDLRAYLKNKFDNHQPKIEGAVFVGDFPYPYSLTNYPEDGIRPVLSMEFYQDLDGNYTETTYPNLEFAYENHSGLVESEIWCSVIPNIGELGSNEAIQKIKNYFDKNFAYREKQKKEIKRGYAEPIIGYKYMDTWQAQIRVFTYYSGTILRNGNLTITKDNIQCDNPDFPDAKFTYENELMSNHFDFANVGGHGSYYRFTHTDPSITIDIPWAETNPVKPLFFDDGACNTGQFYSHVIGCLATTFLYNVNNNAIVYMAATNNSFGGYGNSEGYWRNVLMNNLNKGNSFGEALLYNFQQQPLPNYVENRDREVYTSPRILFGDGTLRLQEFMDFTGNNIPYILNQQETSIKYNTSYLLSLSDLHIKDDDNTLDDISITISQGENYTVSGNEIIPDEGFNGFLNIPIRLNDGTEIGQEFSFVAYVESSDENIICEVENYQSKIEETKLELEKQVKKDLPGRFYFFEGPGQMTITEHETFNEIQLINIIRGTEVGEFKWSKTIVAKKEGYTSIDNNFETSKINNLSLFPNPVTSMLHCKYTSSSAKNILIQVCNIYGQKIMEQDKFCIQGGNRFELNLSDIPTGTYIFNIVESDKGLVTRKFIKK